MAIFLYRRGTHYNFKIHGKSKNDCTYMLFFVQTLKYIDRTQHSINKKSKTRYEYYILNFTNAGDIRINASGDN